MAKHITAEALAKEQDLQPFQILEQLRDGILIGYENGTRVYDTASLKYEPRYSIDEIASFGRQIYENGEPSNDLPILHVRGGREMSFVDVWFGYGLSDIEWGYFRGPSLDGEYIPGRRNILKPSDDDIRVRAQEVYDLQIKDLPDVLHVSFEFPTDRQECQKLLDRVMGFTFVESDLKPDLKADVFGKDSGKFKHSGDYCFIVKNGESYSLTKLQAAMIKKLHKEYKNGTPEVNLEHLFEEAGSSSDNPRLKDVFKGDEAALRALIATGSRKGLAKLNL